MLKKLRRNRRPLANDVRILVTSEMFESIKNITIQQEAGNFEQNRSSSIIHEFEVKEFDEINQIKTNVVSFYLLRF